MIKVILFDLDGTLLPMDQDEYVKAYFEGIAKKVAQDDMAKRKRLISAVWEGTGAMIRNEGQVSNESVFWKRFFELTGDEFALCMPLFDDFYRNEFQCVQGVCGYTEKAAALISLVKSLGFRVALATNPVFPLVATESRVRWAGLTQTDFELITSFENSYHCKPNPRYYEDIAKALGVLPEECLMVGNDATEDRAAEKIGMKVFLLTDCLINKEKIDISAYPSGDFDALTAYIKQIKEEENRV